MASLTINVIGICGPIVFNQLEKKPPHFTEYYLKGYVSKYPFFNQFEDDKHKLRLKGAHTMEWRQIRNKQDPTRLYLAPAHLGYIELRDFKETALFLKFLNCMLLAST